MTLAPDIIERLPSWTHRISPLVGNLLRLKPEEAAFWRRGFVVSDPGTQLALEAIGRTFIGGFNAAVSACDVHNVLDHVESVPASDQGFAAEGAAMGAAVADALLLKRQLLAACLEALAGRFTYLTHVGVGWALARVPWRRKPLLSQLDPIHSWLAFDGLGFHDTYFHHRRALAGWRRVRSGYSCRAYDQGVGRAIWFAMGGDVAAAARTISSLPSTRQSDLWAGLGLAMAYAGPVCANKIAAAAAAAGPRREHYAQGTAFACAARSLAGHVPTHTDLAARIVWGTGADELARLVHQARERLPAADDDQPRYEMWRRSVAALSSNKGPVS